MTKINTPESDYRAAAKALTKANDGVADTERERARVYYSFSDWEPDHDAHLLKAARAKVELERASATFNQSAQDLEQLRAFLVAVLGTARDRYATIEGAIVAPGTFAGECTAAALHEHTQRWVEYDRALIERERESVAVPRLLELALTTALESFAALTLARKATGLPAPSRLLPYPAHLTPPPRGFVVPTGSNECAELIALVESQKYPKPKNGLTPAELELEALLDKAEQWKAERAHEAKVLRQTDEERLYGRAADGGAMTIADTRAGL